MGLPMAVNLRSNLNPKTPLLICDVSQEQIERFKAKIEGQGSVEVVANGAEAARRAVRGPKAYYKTSRQLSRKQDMVFTMLPTSDSVKQVYLDPTSGIIAGLKNSQREKILVECGTIETATILSVGSAINGPTTSHFLDAPVSGGPMGAEAGTLCFMVGGPDSYFQPVKDVLQYMGNRDAIFHCGDVGAGTAFKVINNYLAAITSLGASEALNIGVKMGLDPKLLTSVINASGGQCWITSKSNPVPGVMENVPSSRGYEGGFRIELMKKVLYMGIELAEDVGAKTVLSRPTLSALEEASADERYKGKDARVVYKWLNEAT